MESRDQHTLWAPALENYQAAVLTAQHGWYNVSVVCSYYAVFTAMWVALGDPPRRCWEHRSIVGYFARGQWRTPSEPIERDLARAIRHLYTNRLVANDRAVALAHIVPLEWAYEAEDYNIAIVMPDTMTPTAIRVRERIRTWPIASTEATL